MRPAGPGPEAGTEQVSAPGPARGRWSAAALLLGGALVAVGALLPWVRVRVDFTSEGGPRTSDVFFGLDSWHGWLLLGVGVAIAAVALGVRAASGTGRRVLGFLAMVLSAVAVLVSAVDLFNLQDDVLNRLAEGLAATSGRSLGEAGAMLRFLSEVVAGAGLYVILAGGWIAAIGAAVVTLSGRRRAPETGAPVAGYPGGEATRSPAGG